MPSLGHHEMRVLKVPFEGYLIGGLNAGRCGIIFGTCLVSIETEEFYGGEISIMISLDVDPIQL